MISHIMVPLDGSELAERALPCAERLAVATGATVHLVRVVEPAWAAPLAAARMTTAGAGVAWPAVYTPDPGAEEAAATAAKAADDYLATQRDRLARSTGGAVRADRLVGNTAAALLDYEQSAGIDLIVMAKRPWCSCAPSATRSAWTGRWFRSTARPTPRTRCAWWHTWPAA